MSVGVVTPGKAKKCFGVHLTVSCIAQGNCHELSRQTWFGHSLLLSAKCSNLSFAKVT